MNNNLNLKKISTAFLFLLLSVTSGWSQCDVPTGIAITALNQVSTTIEWSASVSNPLSGYETELRTSGPAGSGVEGLVLSNVGVETFVSYSALDPNTSYTFFVRSICSGVQNSVWSSGTTFQTLSLSTPIAIAATNITNASFVARWQSVVGATEYEVQYKLATLDWSVATTVNAGNNLNKLIFNLLPSTVYNYRIRARTATGPWTPVSNVIDVLTDNVPVTVARFTSEGWLAQPTSEVDLSIEANFNTATSEFGSALFGQSMTVLPGITFTIASGTFIEVQNIINQSAPENFVIESNANYRQLSQTNNVGGITVKRNSFPIYRLDYTMWSSPVLNQNLLAFSPLTFPNRFYSYNSSSNNFTVIQDVGSKFFQPGIGYLIRTPDNWTIFSEGTAGSSYPGKFVGVPNTHDIEVILNAGYNMVGNPFPTDLAADALIGDNNAVIDETLYFWRRRNNNVSTDLQTSYYATWSSLGGTGIIMPGSVGDQLTTRPNGIIKVGQGFLVRTKEIPIVSNLVFNLNMKDSNNYQDIFLKTGKNSSNTAVEVHKFYLNLTGGPEIGGQLLLGYASNASDDFDASDGQYIGDSPIALTSIIGDKSYVIQGRALPFLNTDEIILRFQTSVAASYTISLDDVTGMFQENVDPILVDILTNTSTNLRDASYTFASAVGIFDDRFKVVFIETALSTNDVAFSDSAVVVISKNNILSIDAGSYTIQNLEIYDLRGSKIYSRGNIDSNSTSVEDLQIQQQIIFVKIYTDKGIVTKKVQF